MEEFANGATQVTIKLKNNSTIRNVLISNCKSIIAVRGYKDLPFSLNEISDIYQTEEDKNPIKRDEWYYWDDWV